MDLLGLHNLATQKLGKLFYLCRHITGRSLFDLKASPLTHGQKLVIIHLLKAKLFYETLPDDLHIMMDEFLKRRSNISGPFSTYIKQIIRDFRSGSCVFGELAFLWKDVLEQLLECLYTNPRYLGVRSSDEGRGQMFTEDAHMDGMVVIWKEAEMGLFQRLHELFFSLQVSLRTLQSAVSDRKTKNSLGVIEVLDIKQICARKYMLRHHQWARLFLHKHAHKDDPFIVLSIRVNPETSAMQYEDHVNIFSTHIAEHGFNTFNGVQPFEVQISQVAKQDGHYDMDLCVEPAAALLLVKQQSHKNQIMKLMSDYQPPPDVIE
jgi:hypothetical protein